LVLPLPTYENIRSLEQSDSKTIHLARRIADGAPVRIEVFDIERTELADPSKIQEITRDFELSRELDLPGLLRHLELSRQDGSLILVSEDFAGEPLARILARGRPALADALRIVMATASILGALHRLGVVHGDITSENILVEPGHATIKLRGLGFATREGRERGAPRSSHIGASLAYASPEQTGRLDQGVDHRSDLYSLGVVLYEALTGKLPFSSADPLELVHCHIAKLPTPPREEVPDLPAPVSAITMKLLSKAASDRYESAEGLFADLLVCLDSLLERGVVDDFPLGRADASKRLRIPDELFGREADMAKLLGAFERAARGEARMVLVSGPSGIGKSALCDAVKRPILGRGGTFGAGKFDQYQHGVPYSALFDALRDVLSQILGETDERIRERRRALDEGVGALGSVLVDALPELGLLLGELPRAEELGPSEAQNRLALAFEELIKALATKDRPLCLFLDDLHWADAASSRLVQTLLSSPDKRYVLFLGAMRDEELGEGHPFTRATDAIARARGSVEKIRLEPLGEGALSRLLAETLRADAAGCLPLARLVLEKTGGNPFFAAQFLTTLHEDGLLHFDPRKNNWVFELDSIREANITENIVELMETRLRRLGDGPRRLLSLAACIGGRFELRILRGVSGSDGDDIAKDLCEAVEAGLIARAGERRAAGAEDGNAWYRFPHDRVRQAAYDALPEDERAKVHLAIGRIMLDVFDAAELEERLFDVTEQLNRGATSATDRALRDRLLVLDVSAARRARAVAAYDTALDCLRVALALLSEDDVDERYELFRDAHAGHAEALALLGRTDEAQVVFAGFIDRLKTTRDKGACHLRQSEALQSAGKPGDAHAHARAGLALFGVAMPEDPLEVERETAAKLPELLREEIVAELGTRTRAPEEEDLQSRLHDRLVISSYFAAPHELGLAICKGIEHIRERGIAVESSAIVAWFATLAGLAGEMKLAMDLAELSLELCASAESSYARGKTEVVAYAQCLSWKYPYERSIALMQETYERCHSAGDFQYASYMLLTLHLVRHVRGNDHHDALMRCRAWHDYCLKYVPLELGQAKIRIHCLARVMGALEEPVDVDAILGVYAEEKNATDLCESLAEIAATHALFGEFPESWAAIERAEPSFTAGAAGNLLLHVSFHDTKALVAARLSARASDREEKEMLLRAARASVEKLERWAELFPENFSAHCALATAELARAEQRSEDAFRLFFRALEHARAHGQTQIAARACEGLGVLAMTRGHGFAKGFFLESIAHYEACGALGKARTLAGEREGAGGDASRGEHSGPGSGRVDAVDLLTVIKASQLMAGELELPKLLERLLRLLVENAGARRAVLVLAREDRLFVEASMRVSTNEIAVGLSTPLDEYTELPRTLVHYVARIREAVVLRDATKESRFAGDPYLAARHPRSALCVAMTHEGRLTGLVYLENELSANVFTNARVELCRLLASQAAIALDNAELYARVRAMSEAVRQTNAELEKQVARRTEQLNAANEMLTLELAERERSEEERLELQTRIIDVQKQRLAELSTPLIPISDRILVMPLIGTMDEARAEEALATALKGVAERHASVVIIDITGVNVVDTAVAATLMRTTAALALLGARALITGIRASVAQTLIDLGVDFGPLVTRATLQSGIAYALGREREASRGRRPGGTLTQNPEK